MQLITDLKFPLLPSFGFQTKSPALRPTFGTMTTPMLRQACILNKLCAPSLYVVHFAVSYSY